MARRTSHLRDSTVTVGSIALHNNGLNLYCHRCPNRRSWTPAELARAEPPSRSLWNFKRRRRCSKCGARGSTDDVFLNTFVVDSGVASWGRAPNPTAPQLWAFWGWDAKCAAATPPQRLAC